MYNPAIHLISMDSRVFTRQLPSLCLSLLSLSVTGAQPRRNALEGAERWMPVFLYAPLSQQACAISRPRSTAPERAWKPMPQAPALQYIYICIYDSGIRRSSAFWTFWIINIAGKVLTEQELQNALCGLQLPKKQYMIAFIFYAFL